MAHSVPGARFSTFDDAGHALFVDQAERFNQLLTEFLAGVSALSPLLPRR
jgi:microsomal epoxide hydrolase